MNEEELYLSEEPHSAYEYGASVQKWRLADLRRQSPDLLAAGVLLIGLGAVGGLARLDLGDVGLVGGDALGGQD